MFKIFHNMRLFNVTNLVPKEIRWSRKYNGQMELLNHNLASYQMMPLDNRALRKVPSLSILIEDNPTLMGTNPNVGVIVPDHAPVTATFT